VKCKGLSLEVEPQLDQPCTYLSEDESFSSSRGMTYGARAGVAAIVCSTAVASSWRVTLPAILGGGVNTIGK